MSAKNSGVLCLADVGSENIKGLVKRFGLDLVVVPMDQTIPCSFWGDPEAGLKKTMLYARSDTPLHSILHEACHFLCMSAERRKTLDTNAGGDYDEENAVCYLQILLADQIEGFGQDRCMEDMDRWGYSFRLGSAQAWFQSDADDARQWLEARGLIDSMTP